MTWGSKLWVKGVAVPRGLKGPLWLELPSQAPWSSLPWFTRPLGGWVCVSRNSESTSSDLFQFIKVQITNRTPPVPTYRYLI